MKLEDLKSIYPPATDEDINEAETIFGVKLPESYKAFVKKANGVSISGKLPVANYPKSLYRYMGEGFITIGSINGIAKASYHSIYETEYMINEWELPQGIILLTSEGHTSIALDYRNHTENPPVIFIESDYAESVVIARNFEEFLEKINNR